MEKWNILLFKFNNITQQLIGYFRLIMRSAVSVTSRIATIGTPKIALLRHFDGEHRNPTTINSCRLVETDNRTSFLFFIFRIKTYPVVCYIIPQLLS